MTIGDFASQYPFYQTSGNKFAMWRVTNDVLRKQPVRYDELHSLIFVLSGSMCGAIADHPVTLGSSCFVDLIGCDKISIESIADHSLCYNLILDESMIEELFGSNPPFPLSYITENQNKPIVITDSRSVTDLRHRLELVEEIMGESGHIFYSERLFSALMLLFLDMAGIYITQEQTRLLPSDSDRRKELFVRFARLSSRLVSDNHGVAYYAQQLCISPQYLARIVKEFTQMTVYQFLQKNTIGEAIRLLRDTNKTILQISEQLNFADQSTFTKYFKRYTGLSPSQYRAKEFHK